MEMIFINIRDRESVHSLRMEFDCDRNCEWHSEIFDATRLKIEEFHAPAFEGCLELVADYLETIGRVEDIKGLHHNDASAQLLLQIMNSRAA